MTLQEFLHAPRKQVCCHQLKAALDVLGFGESRVIESVRDPDGIK
jgi:hypothetical protein